MIVMAYPWDAIVKTITVRDPDLHDRNDLNLDVAFKTAMDGTVYGRRRTAQPTTLKWSFTSLPRLKAQELRDFVQGASGQDVRIVDFNGDTWRGRFTMPSFGFTTTGTGIGAGMPEHVSIGIEFEGKKQ